MAFIAFNNCIHHKTKGWPRKRGLYVSTTQQVHINHTATATNNTCTATLQGAHSNHTAATQQPQSSHIVGLLPTVQRGAYNLHRLQSAPSPYNTHILQLLQQVLQGVSKKRYFSDFLSYFSSRGQILLFHMCFGIRILSPFHLAIQKVSIQNLNCPKNACADMIFIPALRSED